MTSPPRPRNVALILARDLADQLSSAAFIVDQDGTLVYFNERCAEMVGRSFGEAGAMPMEEWSRAFVGTDKEGRRVAPEELPLVRALRERAPVHRTLSVRMLDGQIRDIAATALPLFVHPDELVGAMALFWEHVEPDRVT
jgi:PAS domain-containing protein